MARVHPHREHVSDDDAPGYLHEEQKLQDNLRVLHETMEQCPESRARISSLLEDLISI
jgi:hypothetical protein